MLKLELWDLRVWIDFRSLPVPFPAPPLQVIEQRPRTEKWRNSKVTHIDDGCVGSRI